MTHAVAHHSHHETSRWPTVVGAGVLLTALTLLAFSHWQSPTAGIVLGGITLALLALGLAGWSREFFTSGTEEGFGTVAVAWFIVSEVIIFGTMFVGFWFVRVNLADQWTSYIPAGLNLGLAFWLTLILWASSATIVLAERAFEHGNRSSSQFWLLATFALGLLFVVIHMNEWAHLAHEGFKVGTNAYANTFYGLTGVHTSHVIVGLGIQLVLFGVLATGLMKKDRATLFRGASLYWHFVDLMWILVAGNAYVIGGYA
jgi:cytochrome c oxidase subunit 3